MGDEMDWEATGDEMDWEAAGDEMGGEATEPWATDWPVPTPLTALEL